MPPGIIAIFCLLLLPMLWFLLFMDLMVSALYKLDITPLVALLLAFAIIFGSFINIPIKRYRVLRNPLEKVSRLYAVKRGRSTQDAKQSDIVIAGVKHVRVLCDKVCSHKTGIQQVSIFTSDEFVIGVGVFLPRPISRRVCRTLSISLQPLGQRPGVKLRTSSCVLALLLRLLRRELLL